jgi:subtilase-type serine protease
VQSFRFIAGRRKAALLLSLSSLALLTACGGGGEGDGPDDSVYFIDPNPGGSGALGSYYMASITDEWRAAASNIRTNLSRYRLQSGNIPELGGAFSNPLFSSRVDYAHAVGLTGRGQVIAVVDAGFRTSHEVFAGKVNTTTGGPGVDDHGTMVASIAAGSSSTMVGVAPGASLIFSSWDFNDLTAAANAAAARGAVAQNNSWGFIDIYANSSGYNDIFGDITGQTWLNALKNYADDGVVIFAISNDDSATIAGLMEALPQFESSLLYGWLAVGNSVPIFDDNGVSGVSGRVSARCLEAAAWCLMADGYWTGASSASNTSYGSGYGSSYAAPQVAGALALLAEAFPSLTPHQLRARLLASADNTFTGFVSAGVADVIEGAGVYNHAYSLDYGHGFLDIRAALLPIGPTSLATEDGGKISTQDFSFSTSGAMGDAVTRSLEGVKVTMTDALEGGFDVAAKEFVGAAATTDLAETLAARSFNKDYGKARRAPINPLADTFASHPGETLELNGPDGRTKAAVLVGGGDTFGIAVSRSLTEGDLRLDLGVKLTRDGGSVMGFTDASGGGAEMASVTLGLTHDVGTGGFFALSGEIGVADMATPAALASVSSAEFNSVSLDIGGRDVFAKGDRVTLGVSMPIAVTHGTASMIVPVALGEGRSEMQSLAIDLAPSERQIDVSIGYQVPMSDHSEFLLEVLHAENYGNQAGLSDQAAVIGMKWSF